MAMATDWLLGSLTPWAILSGVRYVAAIVLALGTFAVSGLGPAIIVVGPARADQSDPRLEVLFEQLKLAPDIPSARLVEAAIWSIWGEVEDRAARILLEQGVSAMGRGDARAALTKFDQIVAIVPGFAEGWNKRATVYYLLGQFDQSLADIDKTLALEPRHFGALSGRGLVYLALEDEEQALDSFESALEVYPLAPGANHNAEALRKSLGRRDI